MTVRTAVVAVGDVTWPCWVCGADQYRGPRMACRGGRCRDAMAREYGDGKPELDESPIYVERRVNAINEATRARKRDRIVRHYAEGGIAYNDAKQMLLDIGCSETVLGAERMIHRSLMFLGLKGPGNGSGGMDL